MARLLTSLAAGLLLVTLPAVSGAGATINELVVRWIVDEYNLDTAWYSIEILANPLRTDICRSENLNIRSLSPREPLGLFTVLVELESAGTVKERGQVRLRVKKYAEVLVAAERLKRHEELAAEKLEMKRMEVTSLRERPVCSFDVVYGHRLKRNLSKGRILMTGAIEPVPDIEVGREVSIIYASDLYTVTAPGRVLQSGSVGQLIRVKNMASGKVIKARVADRKSVVIDP